MQTKELSSLLEIAKRASVEAGEKIMEIYDSSDFEIELKGDNSPLTKADKAAHDLIMSYLDKTEVPVLSEEGRDIPFEERSQWEYLWVVDPLDGTKEFIKRNGEFTVNIALVKNGVPLLGVVYAPVLKKLYSAAKGLGAWIKAEGVEKQLSENDEIDLKQPNLRVVASRSHLNSDTQEFLDKLTEPQIVSMGSSLKFMLIAENQADIYPRFAPTMEWDTAAAHAVLLEIKADVVDLERNSLMYNKENLLNPYFQAF